MANTILTVDKLARRGLPLAREQMLFGNHVNNDHDLVDEMTSVDGGGKSGGTIRVRRPVRYATRTGTTRSNQDITEHYVNVPAPTMKGVDFTIPSTELSKDIEWVAERYLMPATAQLASLIDTDIAANYTKLPNAVGTPGTDPNAYSFVGACKRKATELNWPQADRKLFFSPGAETTMADAMKGLFHTNLTEEAVRRGELGRLSMFETAVTNNSPAHVGGTYTTGSTPLVNGAVSNGDLTIVTDGWANSTAVLKAGDVFTIAGIYEVNPMTRASTGRLKQFVSKGDVTSDGTGNATIQVCDSDETEGLNHSGAYQNMSAQIADNLAITVWGANGGLTGAATEGTSYTQSLAFHRNCFWLGMFPLTDNLPGAESKTVTDPKSGFSMRLTTQYVINSDEIPYRLDAYYSTDVLDPNLGVRLMGA